MIEGAKYGTFIFFGIFAALSGIWTYFFVPETKGRTLEQIDALFHTHSAEGDAANQDHILQLLCEGTAPTQGWPHSNNDKNIGAEEHIE